MMTVLWKDEQRCDLHGSRLHSWMKSSLVSFPQALSTPQILHHTGWNPVSVNKCPCYLGLEACLGNFMNEVLRATTWGTTCMGVHRECKRRAPVSGETEYWKQPAKKRNQRSTEGENRTTWHMGWACKETTNSHHCWISSPQVAQP